MKYSEDLSATNYGGLNFSFNKDMGPKTFLRWFALLPPTSANIIKKSDLLCQQ